MTVVAPDHDGGDEEMGESKSKAAKKGQPKFIGAKLAQILSNCSK
jgi:hypothetical protein